jgi:hypothetical protein
VPPRADCGRKGHPHIRRIRPVAVLVGGPVLARVVIDKFSPGKSRVAWRDDSTGIDQSGDHGAHPVQADYPDRLVVGMVRVDRLWITAGRADHVRQGRVSEQSQADR